MTLPVARVNVQVRFLHQQVGMKLALTSIPHQKRTGIMAGMLKGEQAKIVKILSKPNASEISNKTKPKRWLLPMR